MLVKLLAKVKLEQSAEMDFKGIGRRLTSCKNGKNHTLFIISIYFVDRKIFAIQIIGKWWSECLLTSVNFCPTKSLH